MNRGILLAIAFIMICIAPFSSGADNKTNYWQPLGESSFSIKWVGMSPHLENADEPKGIADSIDDKSLHNAISSPMGKDPLPELKALPGSERRILKNAVAIGLSDPSEHIEITIILRSGLDDKCDMSDIKKFALDNGLQIERIDPDSCSITVSGTIEAMSKAFGAKLMSYRSPKGTYRGYSGLLMMPGEIADKVLGVFGLDNRPLAHPYYIRLKSLPNITYTPAQMARLYGFDGILDGSGQCIAIIELGGGYRADDIASYFGWLKTGKPEMKMISVDGAKIQTGSDDDAEVVLDVDMAGAVAPGARIVIYFAPNSERGFIDAVNAAIHDEENKPSVLSISWGASEDEWSQGAMMASNQAFEMAANSGITVLCASGDDGSRDMENDTLAHADFPASSPFATGCGGTSFSPIGETVWNDGQAGATGGGISNIFSLPSWQLNASLPSSANPGNHIGRGVPDVSGNADPETGYILIYHGRPVVFGGTSGVAPLWAGLIAQANQGMKKPVGYLNPLLYTKLASSKAFNDITSGNNGAYQAAPGWDACTGLGTPNGMELLRALMEI